MHITLDKNRIFLSTRSVPWPKNMPKMRFRPGLRPGQRRGGHDVPRGSPSWLDTLPRPHPTLPLKCFRRSPLALRSSWPPAQALCSFSALCCQMLGLACKVQHLAASLQRHSLCLDTKYHVFYKKIIGSRAFTQRRLGEIRPHF